MTVHIRGMHYCLPDGRLTQEELSRRFSEKQVQNIAKVSGIEERRVAPVGQTASDLAWAAAEGLLNDLNIDRASIDKIIVCTQMPDYQIPATACILHQRLGLSDNCAAFDINQGCAAFPYGMGVARGFLLSGMAKRILLLNADVLSPLIHPMDRGLVTLHGDGACATLLEVELDSEGGVEFVELGADGKGWQHIHIPASGARCPRGSSAELLKDIIDDSGSVRNQETLYMNGPAVFQFSIGKVPAAILQAIQNAALTIDDFQLVLLHQANKMMLDLIYKKLKVPSEKQFMFSAKIGNLGGSSSAVLLAEALRQQKIKTGDRTLISAFGNGLAWGVMGIRWTQIAKTLTLPVTYSELVSSFKN